MTASHLPSSWWRKSPGGTTGGCYGCFSHPTASIQSCIWISHPSFPRVEAPSLKQTLDEMAGHYNPLLPWWRHSDRGFSGAHPNCIFLLQPRVTLQMRILWRRQKAACPRVWACHGHSGSAHQLTSSTPEAVYFSLLLHLLPPAQLVSSPFGQQT